MRSFPLRVAVVFAVVSVSALVGCAGEASSDGAYYPDAGGSTDAGTQQPVGCISSNECPAGYVCNDFGRCEMPTPTGDGGVPPPEVEYELGEGQKGPQATNVRVI